MKQVTAFTYFFILMLFLGMSLYFREGQEGSAEAASGEVRGTDGQILWATNALFSPQYIARLSRTQVNQLCSADSGVPETDINHIALLSISKQDSVAALLRRYNVPGSQVLSSQGDILLPTFVFNTAERSFVLHSPIPGVSDATPAITNSTPTGDFDPAASCTDRGTYSGVVTGIALFRTNAIQCQYPKARLLCLSTTAQ